MRRRILPLVLLVAVAQWPTPAPAGQELGVTLALIEQSPWTGPRVPLRMVVRATNSSPRSLDLLSLALTIRAPARSRSVYELSLRAAATSAIFTYSFSHSGTLDPGQTRDFDLTQGLGPLTARNESALYPLEVELRSNDVPVATLRSPMVFLIEEVKVRLNLSWTWILSAPVSYGPDGRFVGSELEESIAPRGQLAGMVEALEGLDGAAATVVVSPMLVEQLQAMQDGYEVIEGASVRSVPAGSAGGENARAMLEALRRVAAGPRTELVALPYGDPSIPALFDAGLGNDFPLLSLRGRDVVSGALRADPVENVVRPPFSHLDPGTLVRLVDSGGRIVLLDGGSVPPAEDVTFSPPPVVRLSGGGRIASVPAPDPELGALVRAYQTDPRLAAHVALGQLAAIWFEFPGTPGRGAAVLFPEGPSLPPEFFGTFAELVRAAPWLTPRTAARFVDTVDPPRSAVLGPRTFPPLDEAYVARLQRTKADLRRFEATFPDVGKKTEPLRQSLLLAEASTFITQPSLGARFIESVETAISDVYARVSVPRQVFTLTSQSGTIPVEVRNDTGRALRVRIRLVADRRLEVVGASALELVLPKESRVLRFSVRANTTGLVPIKVQVQTPSVSAVRETIAESQILIRSTAYNRVALVLTIGAALFLVVFWARRLLPRRRS